MIIKHIMSAGPSSFSSNPSANTMSFIPGPIVESDFEWDNGDTTWGDTASYDTLWDNVRYTYMTPTGQYTLTGGDSTGKYVHPHKDYWLEAGGVCGMWLEDDNRTFTEWWDEVSTTTPWDQGKTPWDTKNDFDTVWDEKGTGKFQKTYWYDFEAIGEFLLEGQNAGRGYTLHAITGEFNVVGDDIVDKDQSITRRFRTGSFVLKGIRALMHVNLSLKVKAEEGAFSLTGSPSTGIYVPRGTIDHTLDAQPRFFILRGNESKGVFKKKSLFAGTGEFFIGNEEQAEWDNNTTIWQEDDGTDTEWWDAGIGQAHANFHLERRSKYGDFHLTGYDLIGGTATNFKANAGAFTLSGQSANLINNVYYSVTADTGMFTLTGNGANGYVGGYAYTGKFAVSGKDINLQRDRLLKAQPRHFKLSGGNSESTIYKIFYVDSTSYTFTGMDVKAKVKGGSKTGEFILTGQEALREDHRGLSANAGSFTLEGVSSGVHRFWDVYGTSYILTGEDTNQHRRHINTAGTFKLEGQEASRNRYPTLKVTEAGIFTVTGSDLSITHGRSTLEGTSFVVDGQSANVTKDITRTHEPTHYVLEGYGIDCGYEEREKASKGTFHFYGKNAGLIHTQHHEVSLNAAAFTVNGKPTEQDRNQTLFAEAGHFVVKYDCESKSLRAKTGEFELSGIRAVFNSKHYSFHAGPETHFRVELQTVGRYNNHDYGKTLEYKLTGSDVLLRCGDVSYTRWDSLKTNWDVFKTLWDKKYGADKPCPIRPATVIPAHFELNGSKISGYTQDTIYPRPFECGHFTLEGGSINNVWEDGTLWIDTSLRKAQVLSTRFFETEWEEADGTDTHWDVYAGTGIQPPLSAEVGHFRVELTHVGYQTDAVNKTTEFTLTGNTARGLWYKAELQATLWDEADGFTEWEDPETLWYDPTGIGSIEEVLPENTIAAEVGEFNVNGQDSNGDHWKKPANVILLANHMAEYKVSTCDDKNETFWDLKRGTEWFDKCYGTALWDSDTMENAVKWDYDEAYRTLWDKDKSRWDKKKCTQLNLDYRLVANCK